MDAAYPIIVGYLLGSIPFGLILTRLGGGGDLREVGSGNIGATNVLRTGRKDIALATLLLDMLKGTAAVLIAARFWPQVAVLESLAAPALAALAVVIGHCFPVWLKFRGGKGVATLMGVSLGLAWPLGLAYALVWLGVFQFTRISSLAGIGAAISAPFAALGLGRAELVPVLAALALLVLVMHRENLARLRAGTEPKVERKP